MLMKPMGHKKKDRSRWLQGNRRERL